MTTPARETMARNGIIILLLPVLGWIGYATAAPVRAQTYAAFILSLLLSSIVPVILGVLCRRSVLGALALSLAFNIGLGIGSIILQRQWASRHSTGATRSAPLSSVEISILAIGAGLSLLCLIPCLVRRASREP